MVKLDEAVKPGFVYDNSTKTLNSRVKYQVCVMRNHEATNSKGKHVITIKQHLKGLLNLKAVGKAAL